MVGTPSAEATCIAPLSVQRKSRGETARTGHGRRIFAQFRQRGVAGTAERGDQIEVVKALVQPSWISRRRGNGASQKQTASAPRITEALRNPGPPGLGGGAERIRQQHRRAEFSLAQLPGRRLEIP